MAANPPDGYHYEVKLRLTNIWLLDANLGDAVARLPWLEDGADSVEASVTRDMARLTRADIDIARMTASLGWLADKPTDWEREATNSMAYFASSNPQLAKLIMGLPWFSDDITEMEVDALDDLTRISSADSELAKRILSSSSFAEDISEVESRVLSILRRLTQRDPELLSLWGEYAIGENGDVAGLVLNGISFALHAMNRQDNWLDNHDPDRESDLALEDYWWTQLLFQPWVSDGLSKEELALVGVLSLSRTQLSAALRELYILFGETGDAKAVTEEEIYQAVLRNTPPDLQEEFLALYRQSRMPDSVAEES